MTARQPQTSGENSIGIENPPSQQLTWEMYKNLGERCEHFNKLESSYRSLASTWLLATFAAVGFLLKEEVPYKILIVFAVSVAGASGVFLLWLLDLMVYHRLLSAVFAEQLCLESKFPWLPQVSHNMMQLHDGRGVLPKVVWFYIIAYVTLIGIGSFAFGKACGSISGVPGQLVAALAFFVMVGVLVGRYMYRNGTSSTGEEALYRRRVTSSEDQP